MNKIKKIIALALAAIVFVLPLYACANDEDGNEDGKNSKKSIAGLEYPEVKSDEDILKRTEASDVIYVIKNTIKGLSGEKTMTKEEKMLLQSLQGIVAQRKAEVYLGSAKDKYLKYIRDKFNLKIDDGSNVYSVNENGEEVVTESTTGWLENLGTIVNHYQETGDIKGYVKLRYEDKFSEQKNQSNQASSIAGIFQYIMVAEKAEEALNTHCPNVTMGKLKNNAPADLSDKDVTQYQIFVEYEDMFNKDVLIMQAANRTEHLREYGISQKAPFYFYNESDPEAERDYVYSSLNMMANAYGWEQIDQEEDGVKIGMREDPSVDFASKRDVNVFAADWCTNLSVWMSMPVTESKQVKYEKLSTADEQKHYVTMLYSDGDNIQWTAGPAFANDYFLGTKADKKVMPFGWTLTPSLAEISPGMLSYLYENMTPLEHFVGSVSGYAYSHPANFSDEGIAQFARNTAVMMKKADMDLLAMKGVNEKVMNAFSDQEEFKGGFIMYGADSGKGGDIYWANGKPFINDRFIMWADREDQYKPDVIAKKITQMRGLSTDKTSTDCYSFIQVHCWSYKYSNILKLFYENIDENVKVITPAEMVDLIIENVTPNELGYTS